MKSETFHRRILRPLHNLCCGKWYARLGSELHGRELDLCQPLGRRHVEHRPGTSSQGEGGSAFFNANWGLAAATPGGKVLAVVPMTNANPTKSNYNSPTLSANVFVTDSAKKSAQKKLNKQLNARVAQ